MNAQEQREDEVERERRQLWRDIYLKVESAGIEAAGKQADDAVRAFNRRLSEAETGSYNVVFHRRA